MQIKLIKLNEKTLKYNYDGLKLKVLLDRIYSSKESYTIVIDYVSSPNDIEVNERQLHQTRGFILLIQWVTIKTRYPKYGHRVKLKQIRCGSQQLMLHCQVNTRYLYHSKR